MHINIIFNSEMATYCIVTFNLEKNDKFTGGCKKSSSIERFYICFTQFSPVLISCIPQYQNQTIDFGAIYKLWSDFVSFVQTHVCVHVFVCACV